MFYDFRWNDIDSNRTGLTYDKFYGIITCHNNYKNNLMFYVGSVVKAKLMLI